MSNTPIFGLSRIVGGCFRLGAFLVLLPLAISVACGGSKESAPSNGDGCGSAIEFPCGNLYGSDADRRGIQSAMLHGSASEVTTAIERAKATRGGSVGCPQSAYSYFPINAAPPTRAGVLALWQGYAAMIAAYDPTCPILGRDWAQIALGGYAARQAGGDANLAQLASIADNYVAQQYSSVVVPMPAQPLGVFGMVNLPRTDPCYRGGLAADATADLCSRYPGLCARYGSGPFSGLEFLIADMDETMGVYDGGLAYDHGWAGVMMLAASLEPVGRAVAFRQSAELAGSWALAEPPVPNHNYTAKLIWLLAELYRVTGDLRWRTGLLDKLQRNLLPGVLMDRNGDGFVDGMPGLRFECLSTVARRPGRMWDGHNALPQYHCKNAVALVAAYVALRDRGDREAAAQVRPYMIAMLDNLAAEVVERGAPGRNYEGSGQDNLLIRARLLYPLLLALWAVADHEGESHPEWNQAIAILWNDLALNLAPDRPYGPAAVSVGMYLLHVSRVPYAPAS